MFLRKVLAALCIGLAAIVFVGGCASASNQNSFDVARRRRVAASAPASRPVADAVELPEDARLVDCLRVAALNNAGLYAAYYRWQAMRERPAQVTALPDPRLTYRVYIEEVETRVGPQRQSVGVSQMIPWPGKLTERGNVARAAALAAKGRFDVARYRLFYRVQSVWYEYYYLSRAIDVMKRNVDLMKYIEQVALTRYKVGAIQKPNVDRAQVELGKLNDRLRSLRAMRSPVAARLNAALNRPSDAALPWPPTADEAVLALTEEELLALVENSPEIAALRREVAKERGGIDLARQDYFPDLTLGLTYIDTDSARMRGVRGSGKDPVVAMMSVNVPLWHERYRAREREAQARHLAALSAQTERENTLAGEVSRAFFDYDDADSRFRLYERTLLPKAKETLASYEAAFRTGTAGFLDLIDAERVLLEFELTSERAIADRAQHLAKLEMLLGRSLSKEDVEEMPEEETQQ